MRQKARLSRPIAKTNAPPNKGASERGRPFCCHVVPGCVPSVLAPSPKRPQRTPKKHPSAKLLKGDSRPPSIKSAVMSLPLPRPPPQGAFKARETPLPSKRKALKGAQSASLPTLGKHPKHPIPEAKIPKTKIAHFISQKSFYSEKGDPIPQASARELAPGQPPGLAPGRRNP